MDQGKRADMVCMGMGHEDRAHILAFQESKIGKRITFAIDANPRVNNDPLVRDFECDTRRSDAIGAARKNNLHWQTPSYPR